MKLYFVRHGESEANLTREFSNHDLKHPLTERGRAQAEALADRLAGVPLTAIYASPLVRAQQTAAAVAARHRLPVQTTEALREHDAGELEGRSDEAAWSEYEKMFRRWMAQDFEARVPGGESYIEMRDRFMPFFQELLTRYRGTDAQILLVGHGGIFHSMLPLILTNLDPVISFEHALDNTTVVEAEERPEGLVCRAWGDYRFDGGDHEV